MNPFYGYQRSVFFLTISKYRLYLSKNLFHYLEKNKILNFLEYERKNNELEKC